MSKQPSHGDSAVEQEVQRDSWMSIKRYLCPCLLPSPTKSRQNQKNQTFEPIQNAISMRYSNESDGKMTKSLVGGSEVKSKKSTRPPSGFLEVQLNRETLLNKEFKPLEDPSESVHRSSKYSRRSLGSVKYQFSICGLAQNELISVGINDRHILIKITNIHLSPNPAALKKQMAQSKPYYKGRESVVKNNIDRYWRQRYAIFERFDEGIKLDEPSWARTPPGPVCEWIAGKCVDAKSVLDAFAGVGGTTIRISNGPSCLKVVANDWSGRRLQCLLNNAKVYDVDRCIELSENNFLQFQRKGMDAIFIQPPIDKEMRSSNGCLSIVDFQPTLDKIISHAFNLSNNLILLLPAAITIDVLCSCINKCATEQGKMKNSCSAKFQKIYYQGELKYILVTMGRIVQTEIKLSHELNFIYDRLQHPQKSQFHHKKLVKVVREQYGMVYLLNLVKESEKKFKEEVKAKEELRVLDSFIDLIKEKGLIPESKINKLFAEHETSMEKKRQSNHSNAHQKEDGTHMESVMEEEKVNEDLPYFRMSEQTLSEESHYSYFSGFQKPSNSSKTPREFTESFGSIIIKRTLNNSRQKRSISNQSRGKTPESPARRQKNRNIAAQRTSQVLSRRQKPEKVPDRASHIVTRKYKNQRRQNHRIQN